MDIHAFKGDSDPDEEVIYLRSRFSSLDMCPAEEQEKKNRGAESPSRSLQACALKEHNLVLTDNVRG